MNTDILQFYAFSSDKPAGDGSGDCVLNKLSYVELNNIVNWRRMFSSLWMNDPFTFNNLKFQSYEHAYQYSKYDVTGYKDIAFLFSLNFYSELSKNKITSNNKKIYMLNDVELKLWSDSLDIIKDNLYKAKYTLDTRPGLALINTHCSILINSGPRIKKIRCIRLENRRTVLLNEILLNENLLNGKR